MGQSESRQRSPPEHQQPQEKPRRRLRNSIRLLIPRRGHSSPTPEPTNNERRASRRWRRAFCRPSPSPSLVDAEEYKQSAVYEDAEEKGGADAEDLDTEEVPVLPPLDYSVHETPTPMPQVQVPHLHVPQRHAEVPDSESQVRRVDEEVASGGAAEEGENSDTDPAVEDVRVCAPLDDLDEETPASMLHAVETPLPAPAPHAQADDLEALDKDAGEGPDAVVDSRVEDVNIRAPLDDLDGVIPPIPQPQVPKGDEETSDGDAEEGGVADADSASDVIDDGNEEGGEAAADSSVEDVLVSVPPDNLDEETPTLMTRGAETQVLVSPQQAQADESEVADGDAEKGLGADAVADLVSNLENVRLRAPLDDIDNESPPIPRAQVPQGDEEEVSDGDAEEGGDEDSDFDSDVIDDGDEEGREAAADSSVEDVLVSVPPDNLDEETPTLMTRGAETQVLVSPQQAQADEPGVADGDAEKGLGADAVVDSDSNLEDVRLRAPLDDFDNESPPIPRAQVPQGDEEEVSDGDSEEGGDEDSDFDSDVIDDGDEEEGGDSDADSRIEDVRVRTPLDDLDTIPPVAQAMPTSLIASSFSRAAAASASPSSISPANASPSSSARTMPQTPPPNLNNIRQAVSAPVRRVPSPVWQSPSTPTPSRTYPPLGGGSQAGPSRNLRTGDQCYVCREYGHWGNSCPNNPAEARRRAQFVTCWTCGEIGHYATDSACPRRRYRR